MYRKYQLLAIALCILLQDARAIPRVDPLVDTKLGLIRGLKSSDGEYSMFMGIPYATVDERNPFGPSTPHQGFDEVFEAFDDSAICPQVEEFNNTIVGTLDCLHLNVYVPNTASSQNRLPVLVWIYGGGFSIGFSGRYLYGPSYLVRHDIILVTLNYRLGPYGWMCLDNAQVPGNQGLKDQRTALKWVKDNIEAFSGDVNKITIFGESAGAMSVALHMHFQEEKLFDKAIMQSGSSMSPNVVLEPDTSVPLAIAEHLGFKTNDENEAVSFLSTVDTNLVIAASTELDLTWRPCVEKHFGTDVQNFFTEHPFHARHSSLENTPILIGNNNRECLTDLQNKEKQLLNKNVFRKFLENSFNFETDKLNEMEELIRHFYIGDESMNEKSMWSVIDFNSDYKYNHGIVRSIEKYIENGAENIFHYVFSYDGARNFVKNRVNLKASGAAHADEIGYLFDISYMRDQPTPEDQTVIDRITTLWSNFVKYGNPTPETSELLPVTWTPVSQESLSYLDIDSEISVKQRPFHERMAFWDLFYKLNERAQKGYQKGDENPTPETSELLPVTWPAVTLDTLPYLNIDFELTVKSRPFHARMAF